MDLWKQVGELFQNFGIALTSFLMAFAIALARTKRMDGKIDYLEALICGLLSVGAWSLLEWLKIPEAVAVGIASGIGFMGTKFVGNFISKRLNK